MTDTQPTRRFPAGATHRRPLPEPRPLHQGHRPGGHTWSTRSRHPTSEGTLTYQHCPCGQWRALLGPDPILQL